MTTLLQHTEKMSESILRCKTDAHSVLLSNPPQHRCDRRGCGQTWFVGDEPPMCKMFDYEKHVEHIIRETLAWAEEQLKEITEDFDGVYSKFPAREAAIIINNRIRNFFKEIQGL